MRNHADQGHAVIGLAVITMLLAGCGGESLTVGDVQSVTSTTVINAPRCIEPATGRAQGETYSAQECLAWDYDDGNLSLLHSNATYNCCLDSISVSMIAGEQTITVVEGEFLESGGCHCLCQYNLDYQVTEVVAGQYTLLLYSEEAHGSSPELLFELPLDLASSSSGSYCLDQ